MANYDEATQNFIKEVAESTPNNPRARGQMIRRAGERVKKKPINFAKSLAKEIGMPEGASTGAKIRNAATLARSIVSKKALPATAARQITREIMEHQKEGAALDATIIYKPLDIYNQMVKKYGQEWFDWEPETIRDIFPKEMPQLDNEDSYMSVFALQNITKTDYSFELWHIFENVGHALNENNVMVNHVTPLEVHECALTLETMKAIRPDVEITEEICAYIAACAMEGGVALLPPRFFPPSCQKKLDSISMDPGISAQILNALENNLTGDPVIDTQIAKIMDIREYVYRNLGGKSG